MKWLQGLAMLAAAVAALWLMQRPQSPEPLTVKDLRHSRPGQLPPEVRVKAVFNAGRHGADFLKDEAWCDPNGADLAYLAINPRLERTPKVQALFSAFGLGLPRDRRLVAVLRARPIYGIRRQRPGVGPKPAEFGHVELIGVESFGYVTRPDATTAWRCDRAPVPPPTRAQGQR